MENNMSDVAAFLIVLACIILPNQAYASPSCTAEPREKWLSEDAMKAKVSELGYPAGYGGYGYYGSSYPAYGYGGGCTCSGW